MKPDYSKIGKRISQRRKNLGLKQSEVEERAELGYKYLSNIERGISIPSTEVIIRLALALDTTPDEFLVRAVRYEDNELWRNTAQKLRGMSKKQLALINDIVDCITKNEY